MKDNSIVHQLANIHMYTVQLYCGWFDNIVNNMRYTYIWLWVPCTIHIINHWSFKLLHTVAVYLLNYTLIMMWRYAGTKYIATYLKTKLKLRMYFLKITSIFISISLNSTYYPEFNLEASWGGCKPILLLNYCTSRETLLACSTVANHI